MKIIKYDEEGWTEKRTKTLEQIKDVIQEFAVMHDAISSPLPTAKGRCRVVASGGVVSAPIAAAYDPSVAITRHLPRVRGRDG